MNMKKKKDKNMTKKNILFFSGVISVILIVFNMIGTFNLCGGHEYGICMDIIYDGMMVLFPTIPLLIFSLITYKMRDEVWQSWWKFSRIWIPFSMFAILISPSTGNWMIPIEKGSVALFSMILFAIISVSMIAYKHFQLKK